MMAAYRLLSPTSWIHGRNLSTLSYVISIYAREECRVHYAYVSQTLDTHHHLKGRRRRLHSSPPNHSSLPVRNSNLLRRNDNTYKQYICQISSDNTSRKLLKVGRARRKMQLKQATHKQSASKPEERKNPVTPPQEALVDSISDEAPYEKITNSPKNILLGVPMGNPIRERYIRNQQKINYPKTWSGWKDVFRRTKDTYLWTHEGFLLPVKKRDEHGNIIPDDEVNADEDDDADEKTTMKEKATDAANQMAGNLQKNISTIQEEAPKLIQMGQQATGISSREELRAWVGEQLKLGTACLTEFMKGYRSGRDDEVDKMLHEYFKDLDEEEPDTTANAADVAQTESDTRQRRLWGRKERRRAKAKSRRIDTKSLGVNE
ncbi:hypothetical protein QTG54_004458 [Skeletonema marinoi]|uniref:Uncharacterized protein n=1 Tax=Skeletonema marinoi TaxID=267567 RepID=A0AAD9DFD7_9STRA|nr:hypothetical protein QTG54_004458 [Skeletonema marinoi]